MTYTPDSLRSLAEARKNECGRMVYEEMLGAADAWQADIGMWKDAERHVDRLEADNAALRERLEDAMDVTLAYCRDVQTALRRTTDGTTADLRDGKHITEPLSAREIIAAIESDTITDGYSTWSAVCPKCGGRMQVVRPGCVQCSECG